MNAKLILKNNAQEQLVTYIKWQLKLYGRDSERFDSLMGTVATLFEEPANFWEELSQVEEIKQILDKQK